MALKNSSMTRISSWLMTVLCLALSAGAAPVAAPAADSAYVVKGQIQGAGNGWVYITYEYNYQKHTDSAMLQQDQFVVAGRLPERLMLALKVSGSPQQVSFFAGSDTVRVTAVKEKLFDATIEGSPEQDAWTLYRKAYLGKVPPRKMPGDTAFVNALNNAAEQFILSHTNYRVAAMVLYEKFITYMNVPIATRLYSQLDKAVQQSFYGKRIAYMLDAGNRTAIGAHAPYFELPDSNSVLHPVTEYRGKYVLVDFWASWCVPCRKENPGLVKAWQQYKKQGLEIISISLDTNKPQWLDAAQKDNLTWLQLCDLSASHGPVPGLYGVHAIPQNFLLNKEGIIVAKNLRGEHLFEVLDKIFAGK
jgi:peroxiredoxin